jgi:hypothetical protein
MVRGIGSHIQVIQQIQLRVFRGLFRSVISNFFKGNSLLYFLVSDPTPGEGLSLYTIDGEVNNNRVKLFKI